MRMMFGLDEDTISSVAGAKGSGASVVSYNKRWMWRASKNRGVEGD